MATERPGLGLGPADVARLPREALPDRLWTTADVARFLNVHPKTVAHFRKRCGLPFLRVAGVRFDPLEVTRWLDQRREGRT